MNDDRRQHDYPASIRALRTTRWLGRPLYFYPSVTSTNDLLANMAKQGAADGAMVLADFQSQGKGRLGRRWRAPTGTSLLFSLLFRPAWPVENAAWLTMIAGLATIGAVESVCELNPKLKWPNDLMLPVGNQWHKFGGMLLEGQMAESRWHGSILGIGINVNIDPQHIPPARLPATSLLKESGHHIERAQLLNEVLIRLEEGYAAAEQGHSPRAKWEDKLITLGQRITVGGSGSHGPIEGVAERTDEWGRLIVRIDNGREQAVSAGDVTLQVDNSRE